MMDELYEKASQWTPSWLKEPVRRGATLAGCQIGKLPGVELLSTHLAALFERLRINCVLDVGGHVGQYGRFLRNIGYNGHIVSFEPVLANFAILERRRAGDPRWTAHRMALGAEDGTVSINVTNITQFSSVLAPNRYSLDQFGHCSEVNRTEAVTLRRLDSMMEDCVRGIGDPRVFLKLDTQGYDLKVLEGAGVYRERVILGVQSELSVKPIYEGMTGYLEALRSMKDMGFELTGMFPVVRDAQLRLVEFDSVLIRGTAIGST